MWSALASAEWSHADGSMAGYTFRDAGRLVAAIRGRGSYIDCYRSGPDGSVSDEIETAMAREGWAHGPIPD